jgi:drug/metabolite transporter (DMT)-like permease
MIQRQQTLWLLLAVACSVLSFLYPVYTGQRLGDNNIPTMDELMAGSNFFLLVLTGASVLAGAIAIFLFKDRKTQVKLSLAGVVIAVILVILYFTEIKKFQAGRFALTSIYLAGILIGYIMATRGILKDEKLVKSLNKLR